MLFEVGRLGADKYRKSDWNTVKVNRMIELPSFPKFRNLVFEDKPLLDEMLTAEFVYVRWEGDRNSVKGTLGKMEVDRRSDIESWAQNIKTLGNSVAELFGYFSKYYSGYPQEDAEQLVKLLASPKKPPTI